MVSWTVNYKSMSIGVRKKHLSHVCLACCMFGFLSFFLAFGCGIIFGFGMREKTGAWAPAADAGEEGEQGDTNAAFRHRWREQLWGQGGGRENMW